MKKWLKRGQVAQKLSVSYNHLRLTLEKEPGFPVPIVLSPKVIVYDEAEIDTWMESRKQAASGQAQETENDPVIEAAA